MTHRAGSFRGYRPFHRNLYLLIHIFGSLNFSFSPYFLSEPFSPTSVPNGTSTYDFRSLARCETLHVDTRGCSSPGTPCSEILPDFPNDFIDFPESVTKFIFQYFSFHLFNPVLRRTRAAASPGPGWSSYWVRGVAVLVLLDTCGGRLYQALGEVKRWVWWVCLLLLSARSRALAISQVVEFPLTGIPD